MSENSVKTNTFAIVSLIVGIVSLLLSCCLGGFLGIVGLVFGILAIKSDQSKWMAVVGLVTSVLSMITTLVVIVIFIITPTDTTDTKDNVTTTENSTQIDTEQATESTKVANDEESDMELNDNLNVALTQIGMNPADVKNKKALDDWASGKRYSFVYDGYVYIVYELENGEIASVCNENLTVKIYERGYEPLNYKDFEPDSSITQDLLDKAVEEISKYIINETSLKTKLGTTSVYRIYNYYSVNGEVKAKNKVDKNNFTFTVDFEVKDGMARCTYVSIDGKTAFGEQQIPEVKKEEIVTEEKSKTENDTIILSWDKIGSNGKKDMFDGEEYIRYYIPAGEYDVKCNIKGGFYVETIELHKEDGYDAAETISQNMMEAGDEISITIKEGQCISLIINTEIELTKK